MTTNAPLSVNLLICESVLCEQSGATSLIRVMDIVTLQPLATNCRFFVFVYLHAQPFDIGSHTLSIQIVGIRNGVWQSVAYAAPEEFVYLRNLDPLAPGAYAKSVEFNLDLGKLGPLGTFYVQATVDGAMVAQVPLTLRRS